MNDVIHFPTSLALAKLFPDGIRNVSTVRDILLVLACLAVLSFGLLVWAAYVRKRQRHSSRHSHRVSPTAPGVRTSAASGTSAAGEKVGPRRRRHRHRRRRSSSYPLNPTLAQTGGLPPVRRDNPPASPQQTGTQPS